MTIRIPLDYPIALAPHPEVSVLTMRRPRVRDELMAKRASTDPAEIEIRLFAALTGQPPEIIEEIDLVVDYPKLQEAMENFRVKSAGAMSSDAAPATCASNAFALPDSAST